MFTSVCGCYWLTDKGQGLWSFAALLNWQIGNSTQTYNTASSAANYSFMDQLTTYFTFLIGLLYDFLFDFLNFSPNAFFMLRFWIFCYRREGAYLLKNLVRIQVLIDNIKPAHIRSHAQNKSNIGTLCIIHAWYSCVREGRDTWLSHVWMKVQTWVYFWHAYACMSGEKEREKDECLCKYVWGIHE